MPLLQALALLLLLPSFASAPAPALPPPLPRSFGGASQGLQVCSAPQTVLQHSLSAAATMGVVDHVWVTTSGRGPADGTDLAVQVIVDGEDEPSLDFSMAMAAGQGFAAEAAVDPPAETGGLFAAGHAFGKAAAVGGWYIYFPIPFYKSIELRVVATGACVGTVAVYANGHEDASGQGLTLASGFALPLGARLALQKLEGVTFPPLAFVPLANVSAGYAAVLHAVALATSSAPPGNNYVEGCFRIYRTAGEGFPGQVVGTGHEDFFNSGYRFSADAGPVAFQFQHAAAGLTHFARGLPPSDLRGAPITRPNSDCPDNDIGYSTSPDLAGCVTQCGAMPQCRGLVFDAIPSEQGICRNSNSSLSCCLFKSACTDFVEKPGDTAWASGAAPPADEPAERISAYRVFDREVVGVDDGGRLLWRVGDELWAPGAGGKCYRNDTQAPIGRPSAAFVTSYVWLYLWPNGQPVAPLPPLPNAAYITYACAADGRCEQQLDQSGPFLNADCSLNCSTAAA
jgi:hypothetical protein